MSAVEQLRQAVRELFAGRRLARAVRQHECAADELDAVLREVLKR